MSDARYIIGVYVGVHGVSVALLEKGFPTVAIQLERILGIKRAWLIGKHTNRKFAIERVREDPQDGLLEFADYFDKVIDYVLRSAKIDLEDVDLVALEKHNLINCRYNTGEIFIDNELDQFFAEHQVVRVEHHQGHQAQAFYASPFNDALVATIDGRSWDVVERLGGFISCTLSWARKGKIETFFESNHSFTHVYDRLSRMLFGQRFAEGKTMGLASYGAGNAFGLPPTKLRCFDAFCASKPVTGCMRQTESGSAFCSEHQAEDNAFRKRWLAVPQPDAVPITCRNDTGDPDLEVLVGGEDLHTYLGLAPLQKGEEPSLPQRQAAWLCQHHYEMALLEFLRVAYRYAPSPRLCLAGGGALNSVCNRKILNETPFKELFVFPNCGDEGLAMGFALWAYYNQSKKPRKWFLSSDSFGRSYTRCEIDYALNAFSSKIIVHDYAKAITDVVAQHISEGHTVGWFQGGSEFGPRALGHRSILAHPGIADMANRLNKRVKLREPWRPFTPAVLCEHATNYFEIDCESPFMLLVAKVREEVQKDIPAVTHVDGTARLQTVSAKSSPVFYELICRFFDITGLPMVLNTSFNIAGKPIVETPLQALRCLFETDLDAVAIETIFIIKRGMPK